MSRLVFGSETSDKTMVPAGGAGTSGHTLVVVFLRGAADTLNMLVPHGDDNYYRERTTIGIARPGKGEGCAIRINDFYGFHPRMKVLAPAFFEGRLGVVQSVGSDNTSGSHFAAQDQIEHGEQGGETPGGGWLGRHLRTRMAQKGTPLSAVAIGPSLPESLRAAPAASAFESLEELQIKIPREDPVAVATALRKLYGGEVGVLAERGRETLELLERVEKMRATTYVPANQAKYADNGFAKGLREIARLVKADLGLEVACIDLGGWDTHFVQGGATGQQADLIGTLSDGLAAFDADLADQAGGRERVTTVVMTEFGRRLYENASLGTDHGRGFSMFLLGGNVEGGKVLGTWPGFEEKGLSDAQMPGPGGLKVDVDYRMVLAEVLEKACGNVAIGEVFPGLGAERMGALRQGR